MLSISKIRTVAFSLLLCFTSCRLADAPKALPASKNEASNEIKTSFQEVLDSIGLIGSILLFNPEKNTYYSNDFLWASTGQLPASTFKIPNSIIALETGVIVQLSDTLFWDGTERSIANWNQDLTFDKAFAYSCVPCYQHIARSIGADTMRKYLNRLDYPGISFRQNELDMFWLRGESRINQFEQIDFLERLHESELPISTKTARIMRQIMVVDSTESYVLRGKTGWSQTEEGDNGWFVGFAERGNQILYFATNVEPKESTPINSFIAGRRAVTEAALEQVEW